MGIADLMKQRRPRVISLRMQRHNNSKSPSTNHQSLLSLIVGVVIGFCMAELFIILRFSRPDMMAYSHEYLLGSEIDVGEHNHSSEDPSIAQLLYKDVRVLCWIMTGPKNHLKKALHVKKTWGKRCNKLLFMSSTKDESLDTVALNVSDGRNNLWAKTKEAFKYIYAHHMDDADWFFKADDDTYTIVENMRYLLHSYSPEKPIYFGAKFKPYVKPNGYMSGGAGYVLSKEAVRRFVTKAIPNPKLCSQSNSGDEDVQIGKCLQNINVTAGDSRDSKERTRFFPFPPKWSLLAKPIDKYWYWNYVFYKSALRMDRVSDYAITFHGIAPHNMYELDYLIYHLQPYGLVNTFEPLPGRLGIAETLPPPSVRSTNAT